MTRPPLTWSRVATSSASRSGWQSGSTWTANPILARRVRPAIAVATTSGEESTDRSGTKCSSASQIASTPKRSAASTWAKERAKASASVSPAPRGNS